MLTFDCSKRGLSLAVLAFACSSQLAFSSSSDRSSLQDTAAATATENQRLQLVRDRQQRPVAAQVFGDEGGYISHGNWTPSGFIVGEPLMLNQSIKTQST
jgi:hypothetical protein